MRRRQRAVRVPDRRVRTQAGATSRFFARHGTQRSTGPVARGLVRQQHKRPTRESRRAGTERAELLGREPGWRGREDAVQGSSSAHVAGAGPSDGPVPQRDGVDSGRGGG